MSPTCSYAQHYIIVVFKICKVKSSVLFNSIIYKYEKAINLFYNIMDIIMCIICIMCNFIIIIPVNKTAECKIIRTMPTCNI